MKVAPTSRSAAARTSSSAPVQWKLPNHTVRALTDFDDVGGRSGGFLRLEHQLIRDGVELGGLGPLRPGKRHGQAAVAPLADGGDQFDGSEEGNIELFGGALGSPAREDIDFFGTIRAG